jgi:hypothetical protein
MQRIYCSRSFVVAAGITNVKPVYEHIVSLDFIYFVTAVILVVIYFIYLFALHMYTFLHALLHIYHSRNTAGNYFWLSYFITCMGFTVSEKVVDLIELWTTEFSFQGGDLEVSLCEYVQCDLWFRPVFCPSVQACALPNWPLSSVVGRS